MRALSRFHLTLVALATLGSLAHAQNASPWQTNLETAQRMAAQTGRLVLIHFWAPWCQPCMRLDKDVLSQPEVARALESTFVLVKVNFDEYKGTARLYGVSHLPTDVIITPDGRLVSATQSPPTAGQYVAQMNQAALGHRELARQTQVTVGQQPPMAPSVSAPVGQVANTTMPAAAQPPAPPNYANERYAEYYRPPQSTTGAQAVPGSQVAQGAIPSNPNAMQSPAIQSPPGGFQGNLQAQPPEPVAQGQFAQQQIQLPPGSPPLGLDGYCPVTLIERRQWAVGDKAWGIIHRGRTYLFLGPEEKKKFWSNPDAYSPVLSGNDPVLALDRQIAVPGRRDFGVFLDKRIYLFADDASRQQFEQNPKRYAAEVLQAMR